MKSAVLLLMAAAAFAQTSQGPTLVHRVEPRYTVEAQQKNIQGIVVLSAEIGLDGRAHRLRVIHSLGAGLDENAIAAVRQWRFHSALDKNGHPVSTICTIEVQYRLHSPADEPAGLAGSVKV